MRYTIIESKANPGNFHIRVVEPIPHPTLGFPIGQKTGFSLAMSEEQAKTAKEALEKGEFGYRLVGQANEVGLYNVEPVLAEQPATVASGTLEA